VRRPGEREFVAWGRTPELIRMRPPEYPLLAREAGVEGSVLLSVTVGCYGNVEKVTVIDSSVTPAMERAAVTAAAEFEFSPAMQRDMPVRSQMAVPVKFRLR
jgi:protein TonB